MAYIAAQTLDWIQSKDEESLGETMQKVALALLIPLMSVVLHILWEYIAYSAIELGKISAFALKAMLFRKNLRMTTSTNKDYSSSEINTVMMSDTDGMWIFIWNGPDYLETALHLVSSSLIVI